MKQLGADGGPALEPWLRVVGGQDRVNAPDGALPPYFLFPVEEVVRITMELRVRKALPPWAATVIANRMDEHTAYLLLDSVGSLWELRDGRATKVASSATELVARTAAELETSMPAFGR